LLTAIILGGDAVDRGGVFVFGE